MAKKITEDSIKKLIEEVLKEERLNEFKVSLGKTAVTLPDFRTPSKKKISIPTKNAPQIKSLAKADGTPNVLDLDDIGKATGQDKAVAQHIANNPGSAVDAAKVKAKLTGGGTGGGGGSFPHGQVIVGGKINPALTKTDKKSPNKTKIARLLRLYENDPNTTTATVTALLTQVAAAFSGSAYGKTIDGIVTKLKALGGGGGGGGAGGSAVKDAMKNAISALQADPTDLTKAAGELGTPGGPTGDPTTMGYQRQIDKDVSGVGGSDQSDAKTAAAVAGMSKITVPMNELLKAQVMRRVTDPKTFIVGTKEVSSMEEIAKEFETVGKAITGSKADLKNLSPEQSAMLLTKISFVASLFAAGKQAPEGQGPGYVWEKMLALLVGGVVAGKGGKAVDVMSNLFGGSSISNKFVTPSSGINQSAGNISNLMKKKKKGESVYYFALVKEGGATAADFSEIIFALVQLESVNPASGTFNKYYLDKKGKFIAFGSKGGSASSSGNYDIMTTSEINANSGKMPSIDPSIAANLGYDEAIRAIADNLTRTGTGDFGKLARATVNIANKLSEMQNVTNEYRNAKASDAAGGISSGNTSIAYADKISDTYVSIKNDYKSLFKLLGDYTGSKAAATFQEGKKITSNFLKKLIEETFKK